MKAVCWHGKHDVRVDVVPEPEILNPRDAIVRVTSTAICGSDLHLYDGCIPTMKKGDVLGHEFMGTVVEKGPEVHDLAIGDRVVVPFSISCGRCFHCRRDEHSLCDNSNPSPALAEQLYGQTGAGLFGYTHMLGGYSGGQAEYVRVPCADVGPLKVPAELTDDQVLFLSDVFPTGYMAAENCGIRNGDAIAVWGAGPVGQFAIRSAFLLGAGRVIAIDRHEARRKLAADAGAEVLNYEEEDVPRALLDMTGGRGPDACIDAVGMEAHGSSPLHAVDRVKSAVSKGMDRIHALREAIRACAKGGVVSVPGVYGGYADKFPLGAFFAKGLTLKGGQTHVQKYMPRLLSEVRAGTIDPSFVISHSLPLEEAPAAYEMFRYDRDSCTQVVLRTPAAAVA